MLPGFVINHQANLTVGNCEFIRQFLLRYHPFRIAIPDFFNGAIRKFGNRSLLSFALATLLNLILIVVPLGSKEQVGGVAARRIVACMQDVQTVWYVPEVELPRNTVGEEDYLFVFGAAFNSSISTNVRLAFPQPASISLFHHAPKAFGNGAGEAGNSLAERGFTSNDLDRFDVVGHIVLAKADPYRGSAFALSGYGFRWQRQA